MARSTFPSQNVQSTPFSDHFWKLRCRKSARRCGAKHISKSKCTNTSASVHFWKLRCRKSARRCGAKHISKSKCTKHTILGPLLEVEMSKKCTPLWREAHFEVKMLKTQGFRHFWRFRCRFAWQAQGIAHLVKSEQNVRVLQHFQLQPPLHHTTLQYTTLNYTQLHSITLNYTTRYNTTLHYTTLHYTPLHYTTFHYTSLHYTTLHSTTLQLQLHNYTPLHPTTLHYTPLH